MNAQLAYEIGAVFLLAALLMFGSMRFKLGGGTMVALGAALALFGLYHYWDQILALAAPGDSASHVDASVAPAPTSTPANRTPATRRSTRAQASEPIEKIIVVEEVPAERVIVPPPSKVEDRPLAAEKPETQRALDPCEKSPYESKARRALKSVGCGLRIIRKREAQQP